MKKLLGVIIKELLVLLRDIPALLFLFIMPALLVIIISITEDKVSKQNMLTILLLGTDSSEIKRDIEKGLLESPFFIIKNIESSDSLVMKSARHDVASGKYQAGIVVPEDAEKNMAGRAEKIVELCYANPEAAAVPASSKKEETGIIVFFDPAIKETLKYSLKNVLEGIFTGTGMKVLVKKYFTRMEQDIKLQYKAKMATLKNQDISLNMPDFPMKDEIAKQIKKSMDTFANEEVKFIIPEFPLQSKDIIVLNEEYANDDKIGEVIKPTVSQTRVPGFTLFAMFFIVIPLTGSIITERNEGAFNRLRTLPVSYFTLLFGKIIVYTLVCLLQFFFMMLIGIYVLPTFFDMPVLVMGSHYISILITAIMSALAAIGFGLLVGTWARSHAQASTLGSLMVVILGILGGVFIPVYLMPGIIKTFSIISPIRWGLDSFMDLFARNVGFDSVFFNVSKLFLFFILSLAVSLYHYSRRY
ncbi:MAG: ABC transporter permease [Bacteroidota bacterium]